MKKDGKSDKPKDKTASQLDEYMEVMQPRTKKGPSWANGALSQPTLPNAQPSITNVHPSRAKLVEVAEVGGEEEGKEGQEEKDEGISDLDWMRRRMSKNVEVTERLFEQSDDEVDDEGDAEEVPREVSTPI
jgi:multiple RNA-binding domain-containing protein 1